MDQLVPFAILGMMGLVAFFLFKPRAKGDPIKSVRLSLEARVYQFQDFHYHCSVGRNQVYVAESLDAAGNPHREYFYFPPLSNRVVELGTDYSRIPGVWD